MSFVGATGSCHWLCVTEREKVALTFMHEHLPTSCAFVFWASSKYFAPSFGRELALIPASTQVALQYDTSDATQKQSSDFWGARRTLIPHLLKYLVRHKADTEHALWVYAATREVCGQVHRMNRMPLVNFSAKRSDGKVIPNL